MTREQAREYILEHAQEYFQRDKSGKGYICPVCRSGNGANGTGMTENPKSKGHFTCWRGCFANADIFQIIGLEYRLSGFADCFDKACDIFGVTPERYGDKSDTHGRTEKQKAMTGNETDFTEFYREAARHIGETDYHRGISMETLKRFCVGYVEQWRHPKCPNAPASPRLIIPVGKTGYLARDTREDLTGEQEKYKKQRAGKTGLFNAGALKQDKKPVHIVEGEIDALSIIDAGGEALALCSVTNVNKMIEALKVQKPKVPLIIALDNDKAGKEASEKLENALKQLSFSFYRKQISGGYKDANDYLMSDREGFAEWVEAKEIDTFEFDSVAYHLPEFIAMVRANREREAISTGFSKLDELLGGGLYSGLYFIGALSSLGKTTFTLQIADNAARSGHGVLIFSLEMARSELMAKTLSRLTFEKSCEKYGTMQHAKTTRGILRGYFTKEEKELISEAIDDLSEWGCNVYISEGVGDIGTSDIRAKTEDYIRHIGKPPVIVVDYAQILEAPNVKHSMTDKQVVDKNVVELKRISRDFDTPVVSISSFNRDNYFAPVNMASFKESGSIEYSSDVLIGLQYSGWDYQDGEKAEKDASRLQRIRALQEMNEGLASVQKCQEIQLKVLKNRNGKRGNCMFDFWSAFNFFREK